MKMHCLTWIAALLALCVWAAVGSAAAETLEWTLQLEPNSFQGKAVMLEAAGQECAVTGDASCRRYCYRGLKSVGRQWKIELVIDERKTEKGVAYSGRVVNHEPGTTVTSFTGPWRNGVALDPKKCMHYVPVGFGRRKQGICSFETPMYPGPRMSMPFVMVDTGVKGTLYSAVHDPQARPKRAKVRWNEKTRKCDFAFEHFFTLPCGQEWKLPEYVCEIHADWHAAARRYRAWFDGVHKVRASSPAWARDLTGWLLVIMRQQNEELIWSYRDIPLLCDLAERNGLNMIGLFGWTKGGHDHLYPDYDPSPEMGGVAALKAGIAEAHRRGIRVCIYANGQLEQVGATKFWQQYGEKLALRKRDGSMVLQHYHKYKNIPDYDFALGCLVGKPWHDRMLSLAEQAERFGADAILYDQLGMFSPFHCFGEGHGHPTPTWTYAEERPCFTRSIAESIRRRNPNFAVATEGFHDSVLDSMAFFHGCTPGCFDRDVADFLRRAHGDVSGPFPELVRYIFPEFVSTLRRSTPMLRPEMAAYAAVMGFRHDIELRYTPDREYALEGKLGDYSLVVGPPNLGDMKRTSAKTAAANLKRIADFQRLHGKYLLRGKFVDDEGFKCESKAIVAKRFVAEDGTSAVCVWNISGRPVEISPGGSRAVASAIMIEGLGNPVGVAAPQGTATEGPLAGNSLRLYLFAK